MSWKPEELVGVKGLTETIYVRQLQAKDYKTGEVWISYNRQALAKRFGISERDVHLSIHNGLAIKNRWVVRGRHLKDRPWPEIEDLEPLPERVWKALSIAVEVRSVSTGKITTYRSCNLAAKATGLSNSSIMRWIKQKDYRIKDGLYQFKGKNDKTKWIDIPVYSKGKNLSMVRGSLKVFVKYPTGGNKTYDSKLDAITAEKLSTTSLNKALKSGEPDSKGRLWALA